MLPLSELGKLILAHDSLPQLTSGLRNNFGIAHRNRNGTVHVHLTEASNQIN